MKQLHKIIAQTASKTRNATGIDDIKRKIGWFLSDNLHYDLHENENLFALGFVKSISILQLVLFIEREFDIRIENLHLDIDSFRTVVTIAELVKRKIANSPQGELRHLMVAA